MASHLSTVGFPIKDEIEFTNLAYQTIEKGEQTKLRSGAIFHKRQINDGIELLAISKEGKIACFKPYFKGTSTIKVTLSKGFLPGDCGFEKKLMAASSPDGIPILFDFAYFHEVPERIDTSKEYDLHLTAFAEAFECYDKREEFGIKHPELAPIYYIPTGTFDPRTMKEKNDPEAMFAGEVLDTKVITNFETRKEIRWVKVRTLIGDIDVVVDESGLEKKPVKGGIIYGGYWLIGEVDFPITASKKPLFGLFRL